MPSRGIKISRLLLPMPAAAMSWAVLMTIAEPAMRKAAGVKPAEIEYPSSEFFLGFILSVLFGGVMQLCIGWPTTRYLRNHNSPASAYFRTGAIVSLVLLAVPIAGAWMDGLPVRQLFSIDVLLAAVILTVPVFGCYGITGMIEHPNVPPAN